MDWNPVDSNKYVCVTVVRSIFFFLAYTYANLTVNVCKYDNFLEW